MALSDHDQTSVNTTNIADLVKAVRLEKDVQFIQSTLTDHIKKQNGSMEKISISMDKAREAQSASLERVHSKIDSVSNGISTRWTKNQVTILVTVCSISATMIGILTTFILTNYFSR